MIQKITKIFKSQSEFTKNLEKSSLTKDNFVFRQEDIDLILQYMIDEKFIKEFFDVYIAQEMQTYTIKMKMLIIIHQIINLSEEFSSIFNCIRFHNFNKLKHCNRNNEAWLLQSIQIPFLQYLQKLSINIKDIKSYRTCLFRKQVLNTNLVIDSFKLINIVNQALSLAPNLKTALTNYPYDFLLKRAAFNIYQEIHTFQRQLINSLSALLNENSQAKEVEIYEFLKEVQAIEQKMMYFYQFHKKFDPSQSLIPPLKLKIDSESAKYIERSAIQEREACQQSRQAKTKREISSSSPIIDYQLSCERKKREPQFQNLVLQMNTQANQAIVWGQQKTFQEVTETNIDEKPKQDEQISQQLKQ
ncbi:unnamed protein product [Paramecium sonneborni]|uniref:Uncharacterized protein n=1 Tax=Paramecium sonneborni TaxID=65129 RepID=A0A8S1LRI0_9CILI|nr:unnamed protein product [Paramecium sonneborni]